MDPWWERRHSCRQSASQADWRHECRLSHDRKYFVHLHNAAPPISFQTPLCKPMKRTPWLVTQGSTCYDTSNSTIIRMGRRKLREAPQAVNGDWKPFGKGTKQIVVGRKHNTQ